MSDKQVAVGRDERRKIAKKLRAAAVYLPNDIDSDDLEMAIATTVCNYDVPNVERLLNRLADLIEPEPERTCRDVGNNDKFVCSECGARFDYEGWYDDPTYWVDDVAAAVKYCPNCRAMVIYGDNR